jgi:hypothetical protein
VNIHMYKTVIESTRLLSRAQNQPRECISDVPIGGSSTCVAPRGSRFSAFLSRSKKRGRTQPIPHQTVSSTTTHPSRRGKLHRHLGSSKVELMSSRKPNSKGVLQGRSDTEKARTASQRMGGRAKCCTNDAINARRRETDGQPPMRTLRTYLFEARVTNSGSVQRPRHGNDIDASPSTLFAASPTNMNVTSVPNQCEDIEI